MVCHIMEHIKVGTVRGVEKQLTNPIFTRTLKNVSCSHEACKIFDAQKPFIQLPFVKLVPTFVGLPLLKYNYS